MRGGSLNHRKASFAQMSLSNRNSAAKPVEGFAALLLSRIYYLLRTALASETIMAYYLFRRIALLASVSMIMGSRPYWLR